MEKASVVTASMWKNSEIACVCFVNCVRYYKIYEYRHLFSIYSVNLTTSLPFLRCRKFLNGVSECTSGQVPIGVSCGGRRNFVLLIHATALVQHFLADIYSAADVGTRVIDVRLQFPEKAWNLCPAERWPSVLTGMYGLYQVPFLNKISNILVDSVVVALGLPKRI